MPRLAKEDLKKILIELAPKYNEAFTEEMESMTEIVDARKIRGTQLTNKEKEIKKEEEAKH